MNDQIAARRARRAPPGSTVAWSSIRAIGFSPELVFSLLSTALPGSTQSNLARSNTAESPMSTREYARASRIPGKDIGEFKTDSSRQARP